jgi:hypothetical protein
MPQLKVNQIIFIIPEGKRSLVPVKVTEEVTKKNAKGSVTTYIVTAVTPEGMRTQELGKIPGEIFETVTMARKALVERTIASVNALVDAAQLNAKKWFPDSFEENLNDDETLEAKSLPSPDDEDAYALLDDGRRVKVKLPESLKG